MARSFMKPNVGSTGIRRIVPMIGIDFIAGDLKKKGRVVKRGDDNPYGFKPASIGGRTRKWSFVNFIAISSNVYDADPTNAQLNQRENFTIAVQSANATIQDLSSVAQVTLDWKEGTVRVGINPNNYATIRGWVAAVRQAQIEAGTTITPTTSTWIF